MSKYRAEAKRFIADYIEHRVLKGSDWSDTPLHENPVHNKGLLNAIEAELADLRRRALGLSQKEVAIIEYLHNNERIVQHKLSLEFQIFNKLRGKGIVACEVGTDAEGVTLTYTLTDKGMGLKL